MLKLILASLLLAQSMANAEVECDSIEELRQVKELGIEGHLAYDSKCVVDLDKLGDKEESEESVKHEIRTTETD